MLTLVAFKKDSTRREIPVKPGTTVIIGRKPEADIRIPLNEVSRAHCRLVLNGTKATIEDLGSSNGTLVNDQKIAGETVLKAGDRIMVGPVMFVVQFDGQPADVVDPFAPAMKTPVAPKPAAPAKPAAPVPVAKAPPPPAPAKAPAPAKPAAPVKPAAKKSTDPDDFDIDDLSDLDINDIGDLNLDDDDLADLLKDDAPAKPAAGPAKPGPAPAKPAPAAPKPAPGKAPDPKGWGKKK